MVLRHDHGVRSIRRKIDGTVDRRRADRPDTFRPPDCKLAGADIVVEFLVGRAAEQVLIGTDRLLLTQHFLYDGRLGNRLLRRLSMAVGYAFEKNVLVVEEPERAAVTPEYRVHTVGSQAFCLCSGDIHPPEFHMIRVCQRESHVAAARRPGQELDTRVGRQSAYRTHGTGSHIEQFQPVEPVLAGLAEVAGIHTDSAYTGLACRKFRNRHVPVGAISHHGFRMVGRKTRGRERTGHRQALDFRGRMTETVSKSRNAANQQKGSGQSENTFHIGLGFMLQM